MSDELAMLDGVVAPASETFVPATDEGLIRGDGVFEVDPRFRRRLGRSLLGLPPGPHRALGLEPAPGLRARGRAVRLLDPEAAQILRGRAEARRSTGALCIVPPRAEGGGCC